MKYIVGYQLVRDRGYVDLLCQKSEQIKEVYFSPDGFASGRGALPLENEINEQERILKKAEDFNRLHIAGLSFNLLFNGNYYGRDSLSRAFYRRIGDCVDYYATKYRVSSITTASPVIAKFIKENFDCIDVRASVNMKIGSIEGLEYMANTFDSFYIQRELNRNAEGLDRVKKWCDANGKKMYLLANSGCLNNCSAHTFHDNLVSHEAQIAVMDNGYTFDGMCWSYLKDEKNRATWLAKTNFIRPEDVCLYEKYTDAVKLATRVNSMPETVVKAYLRGSFSGAVTSLLEPNHSSVFYPCVVENKMFPQDFAYKVMNCNKVCEECGYCKDVLKKSLIDIGGI